ncbi:MAG TPA: hypothetical protein VFI02_17170 [Armatimonadota bacterium]|nr:hypothetical protein [Armatimonadota bacterium]
MARIAASWILEYGKKFLGVKYRMAAKAKLVNKRAGGFCYRVWDVGKDNERLVSRPDALDCSGFTFLICRGAPMLTGEAGILLPHGSYFQVNSKHTKPCTTDEAMKTAGCLLLHVNSKDQTDHVEMSLGDGKHTIGAVGGKVGKVAIMTRKASWFKYGRKLEGVHYQGKEVRS